MTDYSIMRGGRPGGVVHHLDREGNTLCGTHRTAMFEFGGTVDCVKCRAKAPLLPCPFCGEAPRVFERQAHDDPFHIWCAHCDVGGPSRNGASRVTDWFSTRLETVEAWNRRLP